MRKLSKYPNGSLGGRENRCWCQIADRCRNSGGDAVVYFDPSFPEDIAEKIKSVIDDRALQGRVVEKSPSSGPRI